jgi:mRNA-degrading endonuclease RelE of RelBE toxin-antitoxin system
VKVQYRKSFLRDLKKLRGGPIYDRIFALAFTTLPEVDRLVNLKGVKAMKGYPNRYRIQIGNYYTVTLILMGRVERAALPV